MLGRRWSVTVRLLVLLLPLLAVAPGQGHADEGEGLVTPVRIGRADAPLAVSMWAQQDYSHLAAREETAKVFEQIFRDWARANPDIRIDISVMPALEMHKAKLMMAAASGRLPDIASIDSFWMPLFKMGEQVKPLDPYWPAEDRADFLPFSIDTLTGSDGHLYGL